MTRDLNRAIELRANGDLQESNQLLLQLVSEDPDDASINYQCAWSFDALGEESQAVPYYEKAIQLGLSPQELEGALLGLGSTYRTLGDYGNAQRTLLKGIEIFPDNKAFQVFYSMTLYNLREHQSAMAMLLQCLLDTTSDSTILRYQNAIGFYANQLDRVWE